MRLTADQKKDQLISNLVELLAYAEDSHQQLLRFLDSIPSGEFHKDWGVRFKGYKVTIARLLEAETKDERVH